VIQIAARVASGRLALAVENPCEASPSAPRKAGAVGAVGAVGVVGTVGAVGAGNVGGVGLRNVAAQLAVRHGKGAQLAVTTPPGRFRVEITLPAVPAPAPERQNDGL
jgi:hypothetical protein